MKSTLIPYPPRTVVGNGCSSGCVVRQTCDRLPRLCRSQRSHPGALGARGVSPQRDRLGPRIKHTAKRGPHDCAREEFVADHSLSGDIACFGSRGRCPADLPGCGRHSQVRDQRQRVAQSDAPGPCPPRRADQRRPGPSSWHFMELVVLLQDLSRGFVIGECVPPRKCGLVFAIPLVAHQSIHRTLALSEAFGWAGISNFHSDSMRPKGASSLRRCAKLVDISPAI